MRPSPKVLVPLLPLCLALAAGPAAADPVRQLGKTVTAWQDDAVHLVVSSRWASLHFQGEPWLRLDVGLSAASGRPVTVHREDVALLAPDGSRIPLPSQARFAREVGDVMKIEEQARVQRDPIDGYFPSARRLRPLELFAIPGRRGLAFDEISVSHWQLARGPVYFPAPGGSFPPGRYTLLVKNGELDVRLPFDLPPAPPVDGGGTASVPRG